MLFRADETRHLRKTHAMPIHDGSDLPPQMNLDAAATDVDEERRIEAAQTVVTFHQWMEYFDCRCTPVVAKTTTVSTALTPHLLQLAIVCVRQNQ